MGSRVTGINDYALPQPIDRHPLVPRNDPRTLPNRLEQPFPRQQAVSTYKAASEQVHTPSNLAIFIRAGHLFETPGQIIDIWI